MQCCEKNCSCIDTSGREGADLWGRAFLDLNWSSICWACASVTNDSWLQPPLACRCHRDTAAGPLTQLVEEMKMWCTQTLHTQASRHLTFTSPIFTRRGSVSHSQTEDSNISNSSHLSSLFHQFALHLNPPGGEYEPLERLIEVCHILYMYLIICIMTWPYVLRSVFICQSSRSNIVVTYSLSACIVSEHVLFGCIRKGSFSLLHHSYH